MTVESLFLVIGGIVTICASVISCSAYIGGKFEKLSDRLTQLQVDAADHVTFAACSDKRDRCPIARELRNLRDEIRRDADD
jgi:hypothetical protein